MKHVLYSGFDTKQLSDTLEVMMGEVDAGNDSKELRNDMAYILQVLVDRNKISRKQSVGITKKYVVNA